MLFNVIYMVVNFNYILFYYIYIYKAFGIFGFLGSGPDKSRVSRFRPLLLNRVGSGGEYVASLGFGLVGFRSG